MSCNLLEKREHENERKMVDRGEHHVGLGL
jgi:hypothetical protein